MEAPPTGNNNQEVYRGLAEGLTNLGKTFKVPRIEAYCASKTKGLDEDAEFSDEGHVSLCLINFLKLEALHVLLLY